MTWPKLLLLYVAIVLGLSSVANSIWSLNKAVERIAVQMERQP